MGRFANQGLVGEFKCVSPHQKYKSFGQTHLKTDVYLLDCTVVIMAAIKTHVQVAAYWTFIVIQQIFGGADIDVQYINFDNVYQPTFFILCIYCRLLVYL